MKGPISLAVIGPGRAGGSLAIAAQWAGHRVETVPGPSGSVPPQLRTTRVKNAARLSACDLLLIATPDDAIEEAARQLSADPPAARTVAHLSGFASINRLEALERVGMEVGCLHPLQTLPSPQQGAQVLAGSTAAVTARSQAAARRLRSFAHSLSISTFDLEDRFKPLYHAGAATVALGVPTILGVAADLFEAAGVPLKQASVLARQVMENSFQLGPDQSVTGPFVRGDRGTLVGHLKAAEAISPQLAHQYQLLGRLAAYRAGIEDPTAGTTADFETRGNP